jgi:hypothetical protein
MVQEDWDVRADPFLTQPFHNFLAHGSVVGETRTVRSNVENFTLYHHQA